MERQERKRTALLQLLRESAKPLRARDLPRMLQASGLDISDRTVRLYLKQLEDEGLVCNDGRGKKTLTERGAEAVRSAHVLQRVGFLSAKIDRMTYRMNFDLQRRAGEVVVNTSFLPAAQLLSCIDPICEVFAKGYAMGDRVALLPPGRRVGESVVPEGNVGFCTVCSITINGVLLKHGVPTRSRFGGLLRLTEGQAEQFVELIEYDGTSIDPLEVFIRGGLTDYLGAIADGNGLIGASFREFPGESRDLVSTLSQRLAEIGLGALMEIGFPGRPLLDIPVSEGRFGAIVIGGLNPIAVVEEKGMRVNSRALSGLLEYNELFPYHDLPRRLREMV